MRKVGLHEISQFLAQLNMLYSTVQGIGKFRADLLFSHQTSVKWSLKINFVPTWLVTYKVKSNETTPKVK